MHLISGEWLAARPQQLRVRRLLPLRCFDLRFVLIELRGHRFVCPIFLLELRKLAVGAYAQFKHLLMQELAPFFIIGFFATEMIASVPPLDKARHVWR